MFGVYNNYFFNTFLRNDKNISNENEGNYYEYENIIVEGRSLLCN